jgi:hypothetical protein
MTGCRMARLDIWVTYDQQTEVRHVDDQLIGMRYVSECAMSPCEAKNVRL